MNYISATYTTSKHLRNFLNAVVFVFGFLMLFAASLQAQDPFITIWQTDNPGTSNDDQITIPTISFGYNYDVDWGDGNSDTGVTGDITHTYTSPGTYTVEISGSFPRIYFNNGGDKEKILSIEQWGDIGWTSMQNAFYGASNLVINAADAPDLSSAIMLNHMFNGASSMNSDINHWDVSNVTNMHSMFYGASIFNQDLNSWDVSNVTIMTSMFQGASVFNGDISGWDVSGVTHMVGMFWAASSFNGDISSWDVSSVFDMLGMFNNAIVFNADISGWDVTGVTNMGSMFSGASSFNQDISGWDVSGVPSMSSMFSGAGAFNQDLGGWDVANVTSMNSMFQNASAFNQNLGGWNVANVTAMNSMFSNSGLSIANYDATLIGWAGQSVQSSVGLGAAGLEYCNGESARDDLINNFNWNISGDALAAGCSPAPAAPFITTWQTDNPGTSNDDQISIPISGTNYDFIIDWGDTNISTFHPGDDPVNLTHTYLSAGTYTVEITGNFPRIYFNDEGDKEKILSVEQWGDIEWSSMENAFWGASNLVINAADEPDLGAVTSLVRMFSGASALNQHIGDWDVSGVTDMRFLFEDAISFNQDISDWDVSGVTNMYSMFAGASAFNQDIGNWNVSAVGNTSAMFYDAGAFNQDVGNWNMSGVTNMTNMFNNASTFNQDISNWDVSGVTDMHSMFDGAGVFNQDISGWDVSGVTSMSGMFRDAGSFDQNLGSWNISNVEFMVEMFHNSGLSTANYDATLTGWASQSVQDAVSFGANGLEYCNSGADRQSLIDDDNWTITGDALAPGCSAANPNSFVTTWQTDNPGTSNDDQITIPITGTGYDFTVDWGDGNTTDWQDGDDINYLTHTYGAAGTYTVEITGNFPRIYFNGAGDKEKILSVEQWGEIEWNSMEGAFYGASNLVLNAADTPDLGSVTITALMFYGASSFNGGNSGWDVGSVTNMSYMFYGASSFNGDISGWDVASVTHMQHMFEDAGAFNQDISGWDVSGVTRMTAMFRDAGSFDQDLGGWDISNVEFMSEMLGNSGLSTANYDATLTGWASQSVQNAVSLGANGLEYCNSEADRQSLIDDDNWTITGDALAAGCVMTTDPFITSWKTNNSGDSNDDQIRIPMIGDGYDFTVDWGDGTDEVYVNNPGSGVQHFLEHTYPSEGEYTVEITGDFLRIFFNDEGDKEKILSVEQWGKIEWASMEEAFSGASNLEVNAVDAPDLSNVESLASMFRNAVSMNSNLNHWDVSNVTDMRLIFFQASAFNQDIGDWETGNVTTMNYMFGNTNAFNGDISDWDVSSVTTMAGMFIGASSFNQDISGWDVSNVGSMAYMFQSAGSFNHDIGGWNITGVLTMADMFNSSGLSTANYDATLSGWAVQSVQNGVPLGANGLEYCAADADRQSLIDDDGWIITGDSFGCPAPEADDGRILASDLSGYTFDQADFSQSDPDAAVIIKTLPANGDLELAGVMVSADDEISVADIDNGDLTYMSTAGGYGANYDNFDFKVKDAGGIESSDTYTMTIDVGTAFAELTGGEGWQFLANPSMGDTYGGFLDPIRTKGITGSDDPGASSSNIFTLNQGAYMWETLGNMSNTFTRGEGFIVYVYSDDNADGTPEGFPKTLTSGENWESLENEFEYSGLYYDINQGPGGNSHFLIANPHPIPINFCEMYDEASLHIANSIDAWDPAANGGNGDYINVSCSVAVVIIPPFRSFWIRTTDENPELEIPESAYEGVRVRKEPENSDLFHIELTLADEDEIFSNKTHILFSENGTNGLDELDAPKLSPAGLTDRWLSFYSLDEQEKAYAFQNLPADLLSSQEKVSIPLDIQTTESGAYTLDWVLPESQVFGGSYFLRDNISGEVIELHEGSSYSFEMTDVVKAKDSPHAGGSLSPTHPMSVPVPAVAFASDTHRMSSQAASRFELLIASAGIDGFTELGAVPEEFTLAQNYPNPFNPTTVISYQLPVSSEVRLEVYDMLGRRVAQLINGQVAAGRHTVNFDASGLSSGIYLYRLQAGSQIMTKKLTVVK